MAPLRFPYSLSQEVGPIATTVYKRMALLIAMTDHCGPCCHGDNSGVRELLY